ncbi:MAG TPA: cupin domain-containing protein [Polyangia bacterium]|nr:cupin domain-containing protein [Polyangia bacterium]
MVPGSARPACIRHYTALPEDPVRNYPGSSELLSISTLLARPLGLKRLGVRHEIVPPGHRTSWPHAHATEEELVYVLEGTPHVWLDGVLHPLGPGDVVAFPPGTGQAHTVINDSEQPVRLLVVGEQRRADDRITYPLHPAREASLPNERRWTDAPRHPLGPHDGLPEAQRKR